MAGLAAVAGIIGTVVSTAGTVAGAAMSMAGANQAAAGEEYAAKQQQANLEYQAKQLDIKGKEEQAAAQHQVLQQRREKEQVQSQLQARGAASGFDATDATSLQIGSEIEKYGTLQEMMASYGGQSRRAGIDAQAAGNRAQGDAIVKGASISAAGTRMAGMASGISSIASGIGSFGQWASQKYGLSAPKTTPAPSSGYRYG